MVVDRTVVITILIMSVEHLCEFEYFELNKIKMTESIYVVSEDLKFQT